MPEVLCLLSKSPPRSASKNTSSADFLPTPISSLFQCRPCTPASWLLSRTDTLSHGGTYDASLAKPSLQKKRLSDGCNINLLSTPTACEGSGDRGLQGITQAPPIHSKSLSVDPRPLTPERCSCVDDGQRPIKWLWGDNPTCRMFVILPLRTLSR
jgi:hypothetical protein